MAGLAIQATGAVQEEAEAHVVQAQGVVDRRLWEVCPISPTLLPKDVGRHATAGGRLCEEMIWTACGWHSCEELVKHPKTLSDRSLDRHLFWREHCHSGAVLHRPPVC